jgi:hypothetical protein
MLTTQVENAVKLLQLLLCKMLSKIVTRDCVEVIKTVRNATVYYDITLRHVVNVKAYTIF